MQTDLNWKNIILGISVLILALLNVKFFSFTIGEKRGRVGDEMIIGLSLDSLDERWRKDRDIFVAEVKKLGGRTLVEVANSNDMDQIRDIKSLITNGVDSLVIVPHDCAAMAKSVKLAVAAGIPVISYGRLITDADVKLYITFDSYKVGVLQAEYLVTALHGKGRIVRLYGAPTDNTSMLLKRGQDSVLQPYIARGDIEVVHEDWVMDWMPAKAKAIMNAALIKTKAIDGVLVSNDGTAGGVVQALKEAGLAGKMVVTGMDADEVACQRIVAGTQTMTAYASIAKLARKAAQVAVKLAQDKPIVVDTTVDNGFKEVPTINMPVIAVDRTNLEQTVIQDNFHTRESIFGKIK